MQALIDTGAWPNPNQPGTGSLGLGRNYLASGPSGQWRDQFDDKLTWNPSSKLSMFVRFGFNNSAWSGPELFGLLGGPAFSPTNTAVGTGEAHVFNDSISATYVFNSNLIADAYFGYSRNDMDSKQPFQNQNLGWTLMQIPGLNTSACPTPSSCSRAAYPP